MRGPCLSNAGAAYLFDAATGTQIAKLTANDGATDDRFGDSVAIDGVRTVIDARRANDLGTNSGAAYVIPVP